MRILRQLEALLAGWPDWGVWVLGVALVAYSAASVYGRINPAFGVKVFSKVPEEQIRTNKVHIFSYTVVPVLVTLAYLFLAYNRLFTE